jgi:hypothetical protein
MTNNEYKLVTYTPVHITGETIDFILRELGSEALALYTAYAGIVQWQQTTTVKATTSFMAQRMKWSEDKVRKIKKLLVDNQYIEDIRKKDENHKIKGWYIQINYIVKSHTVEKARVWKKPECGEKGGQVLYKESSSALERKESALKESKVLISEVETSQGKGTNENSQKIKYPLSYIRELIQGKHTKDLEELSNELSVSKQDIIYKAEDYIDWCDRKDFKGYKNNKAELRKWIRKDIKEGKIQKTLQPRFVEFDPDNYVPDPL